jgi:hypothetical protein
VCVFDIFILLSHLFSLVSIFTDWQKLRCLLVLTLANDFSCYLWLSLSTYFVVWLNQQKQWKLVFNEWKWIHSIEIFLFIVLSNTYLITHKTLPSQLHTNHDKIYHQLFPRSVGHVVMSIKN